MPNFAKSKGFKLRSGNTANAPFKLMGSSPAKQSYGFSMTGDKTKDIEHPDANKTKTTNTTKGQKNTNKVIPQKIDIVTENPKTGKREKVGETNTSSRPEDNATPEQRMGSDYVTEEPKPQKKKAKGKEGEKKGKEEKTKKKWFGNKEVEAEFADLAEMLDPTGKKKGLAAGIREGIEKKNTIKKENFLNQAATDLEI